ncbi:MAG: putative toxin-antitoxin system toxin component, PIN family, partial [Nitrospirae bacterium]|nr:putative toxin-antitoxin system toxin component, PIN family [Nitrospirota bacterium]
MIKVVFDTNVIISALYNPDGRPASLLKMARKGQIKNFISAPILAEDYSAFRLRAIQRKKERGGSARTATLPRPLQNPLQG